MITRVRRHPLAYLRVHASYPQFGAFMRLGETTNHYRPFSEGWDPLNPKDQASVSSPSAYRNPPTSRDSPATIAAEAPGFRFVLADRDTKVKQLKRHCEELKHMMTAAKDAAAEQRGRAEVLEAQLADERRTNAALKAALNELRESVKLSDVHPGVDTTPPRAFGEQSYSARLVGQTTPRPSEEVAALISERDRLFAALEERRQACEVRGQTPPSNTLANHHPIGQPRTDIVAFGCRRCAVHLTAS